MCPENPESLTILNLPPDWDANLPILTPEYREILLKREVIDLKVKDLSYNEIIDHVEKVHETTITADYITRTLFEAWERARLLNGIYDYLALQGMRILEIDEIFQGQENCYLGVASKETRYLFLLEPLENRRIETLERLLEPLVEFLEQLELVITDGFAAYKTVIPDIFDGVAHLLCQVHAYRTILREQDEFNRMARRARTKATKLQDTLATSRMNIYKKRRELKRMEKHLEWLVQQRDAYYHAHDIKMHSRNIKKTPEVLGFRKALNNTRASIRNKRVTLQKAERKVAATKQLVKTAGTTYWTKKQASLQAGRLVKHFKDLLACPPKLFGAKRASLEAILSKSTCKIAPKILKFLKNNPQVFATKVPELARLCPPNLANTNTIEGIFGILRPFLKKARHFHDTPESRALFAILRLRHNLTPPYTGPHNHQSPLERAGIHSRFNNYLEALFPDPPQKLATGEEIRSAWLENEHPSRGSEEPTKLVEVPAC